LNGNQPFFSGEELPDGDLFIIIFSGEKSGDFWSLPLPELMSQ